MPFDPFLLIVAVAVGFFIFVQFRTAKKRRNETASLQEKLVPGADVMTNYGLYGTLVSINEDTNEALVETTPGTVLRIHRQTILKVVEDDIQPADDAVIDTETAPLTETETDLAATPEFGERIDEPKKPARKSAKKGDE